MNQERKETNETYEVKAESPLLRPGLTIATKVSKRYIETATDTIMIAVRNVNNMKPESELRLEMVIEAQKQEMKRLQNSISDLEDQLHESLKVPETLAKGDEAITMTELNTETDPNYESEDEQGDKPAK